MAEARERLSIRAYARWRKERGLPGATHPAVLKAIREGRISGAVTRDGKRYLIDPDLADRLWAENSLASKQRDADAIAAGIARQQGLFGELEGDAGPGATAAAVDAAAGGNGTGGVPNVARTNAIQQAYRARLLQLRYERESALVTRVDGVQAEAFRVARVVRDRMAQIPDRLSAQFAAETDAHTIREVMMQEIAAALEELARALRTE